MLKNLSKYQLLLLLFFIFSLILVNPLVRGDGVSYFAYLRSMVIDGDLQFANEYRYADPDQLENIERYGGFDSQYMITASGHFRNQQSVGPALLWSPAYLLTHLAVKVANNFSANIVADGFSPPYLWAIALSTAIYGLIGLYLLFLIGRKLYGEKISFVATVIIWLGTAVPVYLYFQPSMSHGHSVFILSLLFYLLFNSDYSQELQLKRIFIIGLVAGMAVTVYYVNAIPALALLLCYYLSKGFYKKLLNNYGRGLLLLIAGGLVGLAPHLISKKIIYGSFFKTGYEWQPWYFGSPKILQVLFSPLHGLFSWTPIVLLACLGWYLLAKKDKRLAISFTLGFCFFLYLIAAFYTWHGISSFSNRFFISLTPFFFLGIAAILNRFKGIKLKLLYLGYALLVLWNLAFIYQWGSGLVTKRTPIDFGQMARQQLTIVPQKIFSDFSRYLFKRDKVAKELQQKDHQKIKEQRRQGLGDDYL